MNQSFKMLKAKWTPIDLSTHDTTALPKDWSQDGLLCLELNANCGACPIQKQFGFSKHGEFPKRCAQHLAVQKLLNSNTTPPGRFLTGHQKTSKWG